MLSMERIFSRICIPCACLILSAKALYVDRITKLNTEITIRGDEDSANNFLSIRFGAGDLDSTFDIIQKGGIYQIVSKATSKEMESVDVTLATKDLEGGQYMEISWRKSASSEFPLEDCIDLGSDRTWLTGQERYYSYYGSNKTYGVLYDMQPFISNDMVAKPALFGGVLEGLWFTSDGWAISSSIVEHDMPLWMSFNSNERGRNGSLCLRSDWGGIYGSNKGRRTNLEYKVCKYANIRETWTADVRRRFDYIPNSPSEDLILKPVWSTWANFKKGFSWTSSVIIPEFYKRLFFRC